MFITVLTNMADKCDEYAKDVDIYHKWLVKERKTGSMVIAPYDGLPHPQPPYVHVLTPKNEFVAHFIGLDNSQLVDLKDINRREARMYHDLAKEAKRVQTTARHLEHIRAFKKARRDHGVQIWKQLGEEYRAEQKLERERELAALFHEIPPENTGSSCTIC
jgi:hypothetical protein